MCLPYPAPPPRLEHGTGSANLYSEGTGEGMDVCLPGSLLPLCSVFLPLTLVFSPFVLLGSPSLETLHQLRTSRADPSSL